MKKTLIIALSCLVVLFAACKKKPVEPTPVDYTANYVGNYMGQFTLTITSMNNSAVSNMSFPIDSIKMDIAKGTETNAITATVTVDNESEGSKAASDTLNIVGSFTGKGTAEIMGQEQIFDEVSGTLNGKLLKQ